MEDHWRGCKTSAEIYFCIINDTNIFKEKNPLLSVCCKLWNKTEKINLRGISGVHSIACAVHRQARATVALSLSLLTSKVMSFESSKLIPTVTVAVYHLYMLVALLGGRRKNSCLDQIKDTMQKNWYEQLQDTQAFMCLCQLQDIWMALDNWIESQNIGILISFLCKCLIKGFSHQNRTKRKDTEWF